MDVDIWDRTQESNHPNHYTPVSLIYYYIYIYI